MKKIILFLALFLITGVLNYVIGQDNLQPVRKYLYKKGEPKKYYSMSSMKDFTLKNKKYRENLLNLTGASDVKSLFENARSVPDTTLPAKSYWNSAYDPISGEYVPRLGKKYRGNITVYESRENGIYKKIFLYKDECGNANGVKLRKGYEDDSQGVEEIESSETTTYKPSGVTVNQTPIQSTFKDGLKPFTPAKILPKINLGLPSGSKSPYSSASVIKHKFRIGWVVIPVAVIGAGIATYFIVKNNLKSSSSDDGSRVTNGGHGDDGGGPITPPGGP